MTTATYAQPEALTAAPPLGDDAAFEIIDGRRVELPPMSAYAVAIANELLKHLILYLHAHDSGRAVGEMLCHLPITPPRNRRPDLAYVSYQRGPRTRPIPERENAWDVVPDLAVEVVSPMDLAEDLMEKIDEYFRADVRQVWVVYPLRRLVQVYASLTAARGLTAADELDGGTVLPGFRLPLADLFPPTPAAG
jgi:Uma2 family endonuclease